MRTGITNYVHAKYFADQPFETMHGIWVSPTKPAVFPARIVEICTRLQVPIALAVQICDELGINFASREDMIAYALALQAALPRKDMRLAAKIGGTPVADFIAFVETMDISDCPRYPAIVLAQHDEPASPATDEPYQLVLSDDLDYEALCIAKCAELGYQAAPEPIDAPSGLIDLTITRNKQERRDAAKQYGFARGDSAAEWLINAREHNRMLTFVDSRTKPKASRPLRIAADPVVKSTVTKARKPYRHCGSGLQNRPVKRPTPKPIALMVMLGSMVDLAVLFVGAVGILEAAERSGAGTLAIGDFAIAVGYATKKHGSTVKRNLALTPGEAGKPRQAEMLRLFGADMAAVWASGQIPSAWIAIYNSAFNRA